MTEKKSTKPADKKAQGDAPESGDAPFGAQVHVDLGFGGLFKGISNLLDLVGNLAEAGENMNRTGEFKVGDNEKMQGVYGFSIRTGLGGMPKVESFGNIRESDAGPVVADTREPIVDVFDEGDKMLVVAELPGVGQEGNQGRTERRCVGSGDDWGAEVCERSAAAGGCQRRRDDDHLQQRCVGSPPGKGRMRDRANEGWSARD